MLRSAIIYFLLLTAASISATNVRPCQNGQPFPLSVELDDCIETPCDVVKGKTAILKVHFVGTKDNIKKLTTKTRATSLGITVPYELPEDVADVCNNLLYGAMCPIDKTEDVVYKCDFYIDQYYPEIVVRVEVSLFDEEKDSIACFTVDIKVKKGSTKPIITSL